MQPNGWKHMRVPSKAPTRETRPPNTGMELAIMNAVTVLVMVQANQVIQCKLVFWVRCLVPFRMRTKQYFAGNYLLVNTMLVLAEECSLT